MLCNSYFRCGGIEVTSVNLVELTRKKPLGEPILEKHVFVPNKSFFSLEEAVRINVQLILENTYKSKVKFAEFQEDSIQALTPLILKTLSDQLPVQAEALMVESNRKAMINDCLFIVGSNLLQNKTLFKDFCTTDNFILSREVSGYRFDDQSMEILSVYKTQVETLVLLRKRHVLKLPIIFELKGPQWIQKLQKLKQNGNEILFLSRSDPISGILGFVNCIRKEPGGEKFKCLFIQDDSAPIVDLSLEFYQKQLRKGLAINVFRNGQWGTYRHLKLEPVIISQRQHASVKLLSRGNLSSLKWIEEPLATEERFVSVCYAALNFRDVVTSCGRIQYTTLSGCRERDILLGWDYAGKDAV